MNRKIVGKIVSAFLVICLCAGWLGSLHPVQTWHLDGHSNAVAISPDGQLLATSSGPSERRKVGIWYPLGTTNIELRRLSNGSVGRTLDAFYVTSIAFSPDNSLMAAGNHLGQIQIWSTDDGQLLHSLSAFITIKYEASEIQLLIFTPDGQTLVSGAGGQIDVWRVADGQHRYSLSNGNDNSRAAMSPDGQLLALGGIHGGVRTAITLYRLKDGTIFRQFKVSGHPWFSADGQLLAISHSSSYDDKYWEKVMLYRLQDDTILGELPGLEGRVIDLAFSPDGRYLAVAYKTGEGNGDFYDIAPELFSPIRSHLILWRLAHSGHKPYAQKIQKLRTQKDTIEALAFSQDGKILAAGGWDQTVRLWRMPFLPLWLWRGLWRLLLFGILARVFFSLRRNAMPEKSND